jgi:hypothetical protein
MMLIGFSGFFSVCIADRNTKALEWVLPLFKKVTENHNGWIWAASQPGQGATFKVLVPAEWIIPDMEEAGSGWLLQFTIHRTRKNNLITSTSSNKEPFLPQFIASPGLTIGRII